MCFRCVSTGADQLAGMKPTPRVQVVRQNWTESSVSLKMELEKDTHDCTSNDFLCFRAKRRIKQFYDDVFVIYNDNEKILFNTDKAGRVSYSNTYTYICVFLCT